MGNIYGWSLWSILEIMTFGLFLQKILKTYFTERMWKLLNFIGSLMAVMIILYYSVWGRQPSDIHQFMIFSEYSNEFFRELIMNLFLYFPLGLTCSQIIGEKTIFLGFLLSFVIEWWQFQAGTGIAQVSDVLCNTLGASVAVIFQWYGKGKDSHE